MGIFSAILDKLRGHGRQTQPQSTPQQQQYQPTYSPTQQPGQAIQPLSDVDVDKVLKEMAAKKGGGGNYQTSIVDLLKLLELDSSLEARKQLATELGVNAGAPGTAEQNIALQKAVMRKLAENGGKVPDSLKD